MTQRAYPLNDTNYTAEDVRLFHVARCTGIFNVFGNDLQVQASSGMNVNVLPGYAFLLTSSTEKTGGFTYGNDAVETLTIDVAGSTDRYDYVSVRYSKTTNKAIIMYVKGSDTRPTVPVRNKNEYEIILAIVHVRANAAEIKGSDIIDCRLDEKYCGVVVDGTDRLDTSGFSQEFRSYMDQIKNVVDSNAAGNLLNEINNIKSNEQKPNLLINSDFKSGIINQKNTIELNHAQSNRNFPIDMWSLFNAYIRVNKGYITLRSNGYSGSYFSQDFHEPISGDYTVAVNVTRLSGSIEVYFDGSYDPRTISSTGLHVLNFRNVNGGTSLSFKLSYADCDIEFIKLEKGNVYTGMPAWDRIEQLNKCQYFFETRSAFRLPYVEAGIYGGNKYYAFSLLRTHNMRRLPSVNVTGSRPLNDARGIILRRKNDVGQTVTITDYSFEVRAWEIIIKCNVDYYTDLNANDVQCYVGDEFIINIDANQY